MSGLSECTIIHYMVKRRAPNIKVLFVTILCCCFFDQAISWPSCLQTCPPGTKVLGRCSIGRHYYSCQLCPPGTGNNEADVDSCPDCAAGKYSATNTRGGRTCTPCVDGEGSGPGASECTICPAGKYSDYYTLRVCLFCGGGKYASTTGSSACGNCQPGKYRSTEQGTGDTCYDCPKGKKAAGYGNMACIDCNTGYTTLDEGSTQCHMYAQCAHPTTETGDPSPEYCQNDHRETKTPRCPENQYATNVYPIDPTDYAICAWCPSGTFTNPWGMNVRAENLEIYCPSCTNVKFSDCAFPQLELENVYTRGCGGICSACEPGEFLPPGGAQCDKCPIGEYRPPNHTVANCKACDDLLPHTTTKQNGSTGVQDCVCKDTFILHDEYCMCPAGSFLSSVDEDQVACVNAPRGAFTVEPNLRREPYQCPDNDTSGEGSTSIYNCTCMKNRQCEVCSAGEYHVTTHEFLSCLPCAAGTYTTSSGFTMCFDCDPGQFQQETNSTHCLHCPNGTYASDRVNCKICDDDCTFCNRPFVSSTTMHTERNCTACMEGYIALNTEKYACHMCESGKFHNVYTNACDQCPSHRPLSHNASFSISHCFSMPNPSQLYAYNARAPDHLEYNVVTMYMNECPYNTTRDSLWNVPDFGMEYEYKCSVSNVESAKPLLSMNQEAWRLPHMHRITKLTGAVSYPVWMQAYFVNNTMCTRDCESIAAHYIMIQDAARQYGPFYFLIDHIPSQIGVWFNVQAPDQVEVYTASQTQVFKYVIASARTRSLIYTYVHDKPISHIFPFYTEHTGSTVILISANQEIDIVKEDVATLQQPLKRDYTLSLKFPQFLENVRKEWQITDVHVEENLRIFMQVETDLWFSFFMNVLDVAFYFKTRPADSCNLTHYMTTQHIAPERTYDSIHNPNVINVSAFEFIGAGYCQNEFGNDLQILEQQSEPYETCRTNCLKNEQCIGFSGQHQSNDLCIMYHLTAGSSDIVNSTFPLHGRHQDVECYRKRVKQMHERFENISFSWVGPGFCRDANSVRPAYMRKKMSVVEDCRTFCLESDCIAYVYGTWSQEVFCWLYFPHMHEALDATWYVNRNVKGAIDVDAVQNLDSSSISCFKKEFLSGAASRWMLPSTSIMFPNTSYAGEGSIMRRLLAIPSLDADGTHIRDMARDVIDYEEKTQYFDYVGRGVCRGVNKTIPFYLYAENMLYDKCRHACLVNPECLGFASGGICSIYFASPPDVSGPWKLSLVDTAQSTWVSEIVTTDDNITSEDVHCYRTKKRLAPMDTKNVSFYFLGNGYCYASRYDTPFYWYQQYISWEFCRHSCMVIDDCIGFMYLDHMHALQHMCYLYFSSPKPPIHGWHSLLRAANVTDASTIEHIIPRSSATCYVKTISTSVQNLDHTPRDANFDFVGFGYCQTSNVSSVPFSLKNSQLDFEQCRKSCVAEKTCIGFSHSAQHLADEHVCFNYFSEFWFGHDAWIYDNHMIYVYDLKPSDIVETTNNPSYECFRKNEAVLDVNRRNVEFHFVGVGACRTNKANEIPDNIWKPYVESTEECRKACTEREYCIAYQTYHDFHNSSLRCYTFVNRIPTPIPDAWQYYNNPNAALQISVVLPHSNIYCYRVQTPSDDNFTFIGHGRCRSSGSTISPFAFVRTGLWDYECRESCLLHENCSAYGTRYDTWNQAVSSKCVLYVFHESQMADMWTRYPGLTEVSVTRVDAHNPASFCYRRNNKNWIRTPPRNTQLQPYFDYIGQGYAQSVLGSSVRTFYIYTQTKSPEQCRQYCVADFDCIGFAVNVYGKCDNYYSFYKDSPLDWYAMDKNIVHGFDIFATYGMDTNAREMETYRKNFYAPIAMGQSPVPEHGCHNIRPLLSVTTHCEDATTVLESAQIPIPLNQTCTYNVELNESFAFIYMVFSNLDWKQDTEIFITSTKGHIQLENSNIRYKNISIHEQNRSQTSITVFDTSAALQVIATRSHDHVVTLHAYPRVDYATCQLTFSKRVNNCKRCKPEMYKSNRWAHVCNRCSSNAYYTPPGVSNVASCQCIPPLLKIDDGVVPACRECPENHYLTRTTLGDTVRNQCVTCPSKSQSKRGYNKYCGCEKIQDLPMFHDHKAGCESCDTSSEHPMCDCLDADCSCAGYEKDTSGYFCKKCARGTYADAHMETCVACEIGKYSSSVGASVCMDCASGTHTVGVGATACIPRAREDDVLDVNEITSVARRHVHNMQNIQLSLISSTV